MKELSPERQRRQYLNQIKRLQEQNRLLSEALTDERKFRQKAYAWYRKRLHSRLWWILDFMLMSKD
jgi:hypothetical protein